MTSSRIFLAVVGFQIFSGYTIGADQFKGFGGGAPIPQGRWPRQVHRVDEPAYFWTAILVQVVLIVLYFATRSPETVMIENPLKNQGGGFGPV